MKQSSRAKRMSRHYKRSKKTPGFNLVALMDIFTILVFFLLVNSTEVQKLPNSKDIRLPTSTMNLRPEDSVIITVTKEAIMVEGQQVATLEDIRKNTSPDIPPLAEAIKAELAKKQVIIDGKKKVPEVTVMSDRDTPYNVLHRIMQSFSSADVQKISLAVVQKAPEVEQ